MYDDNAINNLAAAVCLRAVKDYFDDNISKKKQNVIIKELRSEWMQILTDGFAEKVAFQLLENPNAIKKRIGARFAEEGVENEQCKFSRIYSSVQE